MLWTPPCTPEADDGSSSGIPVASPLEPPPSNPPNPPGNPDPPDPPRDNESTVVERSNGRMRNLIETIFGESEAAVIVVVEMNVFEELMEILESLEVLLYDSN